MSLIVMDHLEKLNISAIIPTRNEERQIAEVLKNVSFAKEIILIDSFSADDTVKIAKASSNQVVILQRNFDDFSSQKNFAIQHAKNDWILVLDADERINEFFFYEIKEIIKSPEHHAYWIFRTNYFMGKPIRFSGWQNDKVIRLFNRDHCKYVGLVHEEIICSSGKYGYLTNKLIHYSYSSWHHFLEKQNFYASLQAEKLFEEKKQVNLFQIIFKPIFRFLKHYFFQFGILDGIRGFLISSIYAYTVLNRYLKLRMLYKKANILGGRDKF